MKASTIYLVIAGALCGLLFSLFWGYMMFDNAFHGYPGLGILSALWGAFCFYIFNRMR